VPARKTDKTSKPAVRKPAKRTAAQGKAATTLPEAMTGRASPAKAAVVEHGADCQALKRIYIVLASDGSLNSICSSRGGGLRW
jgi:BRCT domain type II-containing protein